MRMFVAMCLSVLLASAAAVANESNKWRLQFSGAAESSGLLVFEIVVQGQPSMQIEVAIEGNDGENRIARKVKNAIQHQAKDWVKAELDDGEDVLIKRRLGKPPVFIMLLSNTVEDVRLRLDKE